MIQEILNGAILAHSSSRRTHTEVPVLELRDVFGPNISQDTRILALLACKGPTGSQKDCGASWATENYKPGSKKVLLARSSGNHATAMARSCNLRGLLFHAIVPYDTSEVKKEKIKAYGGVLHECEPTLESKAAKMNEVREETGGTEEHSSYSIRIIQGQGALGLMLLDQIPLHEEVTVVIPSSGAGTATGMATVIKEFRPKAVVVIVEPEGANDFLVSLLNNRRTPFSHEPHSIAHGLLTPISDVAFEICIARNRADHIVTVTDEEILEATLLLSEWGLRIETSAAVTAAALINRKFPIKGTICLVLTGENISDEEIKELYKIKKNGPIPT